MRTIILSTVLAAALILPVSASAVEFVSVDGVADCNGWSSDVQIWFRTGATNVELSYVVVLTDAQGAEVQRFEATQALPITTGDPVTFTFAGQFASAPGEGYGVTGTYHLYDYFTDGFNDMIAGFLASPDCTPATNGDTPVVCAHTARWWLRHRDQWPTNELAVGDDSWSYRQMWQVLARPAWGNLRMLLARQLVAAEFNAMMNPGAAPDDAIAAAEAFLADNDPFGRSRGRRHSHFRWRNLREEAAAVADLIGPLMEFNLAGCPDASAAVAADDRDDVSDIELVNKIMMDAPDKAVPEESASFGAVKSLYR